MKDEPRRQDVAPLDKEERARKKRRHLNEKLDEALEDTFPGSDPVSISQPAPSAKSKHEI